MPTLTAPPSPPVTVVEPTVPPKAREATLEAFIAEALADAGDLRALAAEILRRRERAVGRTLSAREQYQALLDGVALLAVYQADPPGMLDYFNSVAETRRPRPGNPPSPLTGRPKGAGDCEDLAALFVALCRAAGLRARLRWFSQPRARQNHFTAEAWIAGAGADGWTWAEPSVEGAWIGEHPYDAAHRRAALQNLTGAPTP